jgi:hypothetical protein
MSHHRPPLCLECGRPHWEGACRQGPSLKERVRVKLVALMDHLPLFGLSDDDNPQYLFGRNGH